MVSPPCEVRVVDPTTSGMSRVRHSWRVRARPGRRIGSRRDVAGRGRHGHHAVPAARGDRAPRASTSSRSTSTGTGAPIARSTCPTTTPTTTSCAAAASCRARRSRRSATSWPSTSRSSSAATRSSRSTSRGGISGTVRAAEQARDLLIERGMAPERMVVIDSLHRLRRATASWPSPPPTRSSGGADLAGAVAAARAMRENLKIIVMVDTLEYLRRGGRIGAAQAWIGATLKVKPILTIEGEMQPVERVRTAAPRVRAARRPPRAAPRGRLRRLRDPARPGAAPRPSASPSAAARSTGATRS